MKFKISYSFFFLLIYIFSNLVYAESSQGGAEILTLPSSLNILEKKSEASEKLNEFCWNNLPTHKNDKICFYNSDIYFIGYNPLNYKTAYIQQVDNTNENNDMFFYIRVLDLKKNIFIVNKLYKIKSTKIGNSEDFFREKENEVNKIISKYNIIPSRQKISVGKFENNKDVIVSFSTQMTEVLNDNNLKQGKSLHIKNVVVKKNNNLIKKINFLDKDFCNICKRNMFVIDPISYITFEGMPYKILVVSSLETSIHAPKSLHYTLIGVPE